MPLFTRDKNLLNNFMNLKLPAGADLYLILMFAQTKLKIKTTKINYLNLNALRIILSK